jgi:STE24 endopeptidase
MENAMLILFLVLFAGRILWRSVLQQLNIRYLQSHGKVIPPVFQGVVDEDTLAKMVDYTIDNSRLAAKENIIGDIIELGIIFLLLPFLVALLSALKLHLILQALIFFAVLAAIGGIAGIPFDLYQTFVLEKKYGFSTTTWRLWFTDLIKSVIIASILMGILISAFMAFILYLPASWWFWAWLFFTLFEILLLWLYPVVIAPLFNKYELVQDVSLREEIIALLAKVGLKARGIYQVDEGKRSKHTNAYFTGIGKTKRIVLFDTLLAAHSKDEILSVLAHEVGHWKKKHIWKQLIFMVTISPVLLYFIYWIIGAPVLYRAFGLPGTPVYAGLFLISIYFSCIGFFLSPVGSGIMRSFEREADRMAVELIGTSRHMVSALKQLAKDNLANLHPHPLYVWFYYSHPPLMERIKSLQVMEGEKKP